MQTALVKTVANEVIWVEARRQQQPLASFQNKMVPTQRNFYDASAGIRTAFIFECKKASPSEGLIREGFDLAAIASIHKHYASAILVLCDEKYFQDSFDFLPIINKVAPQLILCKDFTIDPYQIYLACYYWVDTYLLMFSVLDDEQYRQLFTVTHSSNVDVLTEVSNEEELERVIILKAKMMGINDCDLRDMSIDPSCIRQLAACLGPDVAAISESGIYAYAEIHELGHFANGLLIGSALMEQTDLEVAVKYALLDENKVYDLTRLQDAQVAWESGATYGGLIFTPTSSRAASDAQVKTVIAAASLQYAGVSRNVPLDEVAARVQAPGPTIVQLYGNKDQTYVDALCNAFTDNVRIQKTLSIGEAFPARTLHYVDKYLPNNDQGGSGQHFDWSLLQDQDLRNAMLAGGLGADNCVKVAKGGCVGLDFSSDVELRPGIRDVNKLASVFQAPCAYQGAVMSALLDPYFGEFGGMYVSQTLASALCQLEEVFVSVQKDLVFQAEFTDLLKNYAGCPTAPIKCRNLTEGARITLYLEREDSLHGDTYETNQVSSQALLAKRMGKIEVIAGTGAGQCEVASVLVSALLGLKCRIYMGARDVERQSPNVFRMRLAGAEVIPAYSGSVMLRDAHNEALRDWSGSYEKAYYMLGTVASLRPFPTVVREFQRIIDEGTKVQVSEKEGRLPDVVIACASDGSNVIGMFAGFIDETNVGLIDAEPVGYSIESGEHGAPLKHGRVGIYLGMKLPMMQAADGQIEESHSIPVGPDFPSVGPQHALPGSTGRAEYVSIADNEALDVLKVFFRHEGTIPVLESSHALARMLKTMRKNPEKEQLPVVSLFGRDNKDISAVHDTLRARGET